MARKDVLIIHPRDAVREGLTRAITRSGLTCSTATADESIGEDRYTVVLADFDAEGTQKAVESQTWGDQERPIVVALTSSSDRAPLLAVANSVQAIVRKPFDVEELGALVKECVSVRKRTGDSPRPADVVC